nr:uncharacterized protein LOC113710101 [Coffea arabica]
MCFPTEEGGVGVRSLEDMVKAFSCKLWWRLRQRRSIWADYMFSKYIGDQHPLQAVAARPKGTWKRLIGIREMAEASISWSLGPSMVDFWLDTWCELGPLSSLVAADSVRQHFLVAEFLGREEWNKERLRQWLPEHLMETVVDIPFDLEGQDQIVWSPSSSAGFLLSSAWERCRKRREEESVLHLFVNGPVAREVWGHFGSRFGVGRRPIEGMESLWKKWAASRPRLPVSHIRCILPDMGRAGRLMKAQFYGDMEDTWALLARSANRQRRPIVVVWTKPPAHQSKLNTDASVVNGRAAGGGVLRDSDGRLIFAFYKEFGETGVLEAEAMALQEGLRECVARGVQGVLGEVDSVVLVSLVNSSALGGGRIAICCVELVAY